MAYAWADTHPLMDETDRTERPTLGGWAAMGRHRLPIDCTEQTLEMKEKPNGGFSWPESERSSDR